MSKLRMPPNCIDVSEQYRGTVTSSVGAEVFRKQQIADRLTIPGFKEQQRDGAVAIIGDHGSTRLSGNPEKPWEEVYKEGQS